MIEKLQDTVNNLSNRLAQALDRIDDLTRKQQANSNRNRQPSRSTKSQPSTRSRANQPEHFTINGISSEAQADTKEVVTTLLRAIEPDFELSSSTVIKTLPVKDDSKKSSPTILITTSKNAPEFNLIKQIRRKTLRGSDFGFRRTDTIFINPSFSTKTYQLFKASKQLKNKGYRFIWVQTNRVLARKTESSKIVQITDLDHLNTLLDEDIDDDSTEQELDE